MTLMDFITFALVVFALYRSGQTDNRVRELEQRLVRIEQGRATST